MTPILYLVFFTSILSTPMPTMASIESAFASGYHHVVSYVVQVEASIASLTAFQPTDGGDTGDAHGGK